MHLGSAAGWDRTVSELRKEDGKFEKALRAFLGKVQQQAWSPWRKGLEAKPPAGEDRGGEHRPGGPADGGE